LCIRPGASNFAFDFNAAVQAKISRTLTNGIIIEAVENIRRENGAFDADAGVVLALQFPF
jgi:hypothetical protein